MQPDSRSFVALAWVIAIAALVAVAHYGPRLSQRGVLGFVIRLSVHAICSLLVVVAVAATLNQENAWYTTWSDLGNELAGARLMPEGEPHVSGPSAFTGFNSRAAAIAEQLDQRKYGSTREHTQRTLPSSRSVATSGRYLTVDVPILGSHSERTIKTLIWLPPSYFTHPNRVFPVIEAFHGIPGTIGDFEGRMPLQQTLLDLSRGHQPGVRQAIVVAPEYTPGGLDTECVDVPGLPMNTWLGQQLPRWLTEHFRVSGDRSGWATFGYSSGGYCALAVTMRYPKQFGSAVVMGGYTRPIWSPQYRPFNGKWPRGYDLTKMAATAPPAVNVYLELSGADKLSLPYSRKFLAAARRPLSITSISYPDAGHRFTVWAQATPAAMSWLGRTSPGFAVRWVAHS